jgi:endoglycosylceramidase
MADMYSDALAEIRAAEDEAGGFHHLVFFEPSALWSAFGQGAPPDFERDNNVVYAPHLYTGGFNNGPITSEAFQVARDEANGFGGAPVFSGEWGSDPRRVQDPEDGYFLTHQRLQDEFLIGSTLWTWRESCGDPHKAGDYRAGNIPLVWGEFEVDCTTNTVSGRREDLIDQLTRAYVRAAPGRISELNYDAETGAFQVSGIGAPLGAELVVYYPSAKHALHLAAAEGLSIPITYPAPAGNVYVVAQATGAEWSIRTAP